MHRVAAFVMTSIVLAASSAGAKAQSGDTFDFAVMRTPEWALTASTTVKRGEGPLPVRPTVASVDCRGEGRQLAFRMNGSADVTWLRVNFLGKPYRDGDREEITLLGDRIWLYIDGERWEYANVPAHSSVFSNVWYPAPGSEDIIPIWRGFQAVRRGEEEPWLNIRLIHDRLIDAKRIEWGFKSRDRFAVDEGRSGNLLPEGWRTTRYEVDSRGLKAAVFWCARQMSSEDAYILPTSMLGADAVKNKGRGLKR